MNRTFVIAECAATWRFGPDHLANAKRIIEAVKSCGADAAKFQWTSSAAQLAERRHAPEYIAAYTRLQFHRWWLEELKRMCDAAGVEFMCTVYLPQDIEVIAPLVKRAKISSFEVGDSQFVASWLATNKQVIASCGMLTHEEVLSLRTKKPKNLKLLHCVSAYPCPLAHMNLRRITNDESGYDGISDHTASTLTGAVAVGAGAEIIEAHVRLNDTPQNDPDYSVALLAGCLCKDRTWCCPECENRCFSAYVHNVVCADILMGSGVSAPMECEKSMMRYRVNP